MCTRLEVLIVCPCTISAQKCYIANSCNIGTHHLSNTYVAIPSVLRFWVYISGKPLVPMLQILNVALSHFKLKGFSVVVNYAWLKLIAMLYVNSSLKHHS